MENINIKKIGIKAVALVYMTLLTVLVSYYISKIQQEILWENERITITAFITIAMVISLIYLAIIEKNIIRFLFAYHFILLGTVICTLIPSLRFTPFMLIPMVITAIYDIKTGMITAVSVGITLMMDMGEYPLYIFSGGIIAIGTVSCFAVNKFERLIENIAGIVVYLGTELSFLLFFRYYCKGFGLEYEKMSFVVVMMVTSIITTAVANGIKLVSDAFIYKKTPALLYKNIISENAPALQYMKNKSASLYYHSTEVAEMSRLAAKRIGANYQLAYAGGLYHDLGKAVGNEYIKEGLKLADKFGLPKDVKTIMVEHSVKSRLPKSKEAAIVMLSDTVVSAIEYVKGTMDKKDISERAIMENALNKRVNSGALKKSGITMGEYELIKEALISIKENQ